ncbi:MAG TPA: hypothetical protein VIE46_07760 [Gemmatimonadales bacterium]
MGCLAAPFRALGCLVVLAALVAGWVYRDRLMDGIMHLTGRGTPITSEAGRPGTRALAAAKARTDSVARHKADSVVLSPSEMASLIGDGLPPLVRGELDSLTVRLLPGQIEVGARLATGQIPRALLGPLALVLPDHAAIRAAGPVDVVSPGRGQWEIQRLSVGGLPLPVEALRARLSGALGQGGHGGVPVTIPSGVREIRIRPAGAVLYGARKP